MTKEELVKLIYKNFYNEENNCIDLSGLDFTPYKCNVYTHQMKVDGDLSQGLQDVTKDLLQGSCQAKGTLYQVGQKVGKNLHQENQKVNGDLYQNFHQVKGIISQNYQIVGKSLHQDNQTVEGNLFQQNQKVEGKIYD